MPEVSGYSMRKEGTEWAAVKTAKDIVEVLMVTAKETILRDGKHSPMLFIITEDEVRIFAVGKFFESDPGKDSLVDMVSKLIERFQAQGVALIVEGWMVKAGDGVKSEELPQIKASKHPAKIEVLQITAEWKNGNQYMRVLRMIRDDTGKVNRLVEIDSESWWQEIAGRFAGFFKK